MNEGEKDGDRAKELLSLCSMNALGLDGGVGLGRPAQYRGAAPRGRAPAGPRRRMGLLLSLTPL